MTTPEPYYRHGSGDIPSFGADQARNAFADGAASRDDTVADLTNRLHDEEQSVRNLEANIEALRADALRKDLLIANLTSGEEHSHKCIRCGYRYTPEGSNEDCPICAGDGTPPVREPLSDERIIELASDLTMYADYNPASCQADYLDPIKFARAIEAAIKEQK